MTSRLDTLLGLAGPELGTGIVAELSEHGRLGAELATLLGRVDGFYAFESALHVFSSATGAHSLMAWNDSGLWRASYEGLADGHLFFAEDAFGGQFSIRDDTVCTFDPETGETTAVAESLEGWAAYVLDDLEVVTGYPLAHGWQVVHGPLRPGDRLVPKVPFVLGGQFTVDNLWSMPAADSMRYRASIATQLRDLPDGQTVHLVVHDDSPSAPSAPGIRSWQAGQAELERRRQLIGPADEPEHLPPAAPTETLPPRPKPAAPKPVHPKGLPELGADPP